MTQRNRKKRKSNRRHGYGFPGMIAGAFLIVAVGLTYVWLGCRCEQLGKEIKQLEVRRQELINAYRQEESRWAQMRSSHGLEAALKRWNIEMQWPRRDQVVWIPAEEPYIDGLAQHRTTTDLAL